MSTTPIPPGEDDKATDQPASTAGDRPATNAAAAIPSNDRGAAIGSGAFGQFAIGR